MLKATLNKIKTEQKPTIITGDFNYNLLKIESDTYCKSLYKTCMKIISNHA